MPPPDAKSPEASATPSLASPQSPDVRRLRVSDLLGDAKEAILEHDGQLYRLRITSNRKLILTK